MRLDTPIGVFKCHFYFAPHQPGGPRKVVASLHRGGDCHRRSDVIKPQVCLADSAVHAEITFGVTKRFTREKARAIALAKCMQRLGMAGPGAKAERTALWQAYFAQINGPVPRTCIGVYTTCPAGHHFMVEAILGIDQIYFGSAREFCGWATGSRGDDIFSVCERPTIEARARYLYRAILPLGRAARRRLAAERARDEARVDPAFFTDLDIPF